MINMIIIKYNGTYIIKKLINNRAFERQYIGYTLTEAKENFKHEIQNIRKF
jgi:hypothetical protein